eukprot:CAMPEP_0113570992 /NCGR_PEP_ID=MMETSP0015_2-20120614/25303_1 /TAXON_ID=2838 /ORGANISM="Odontella" /LENGTH=896 /DNA_ID=CAMNT_0000473887 /DNA_START=84 /DNA_END=2774 /DNA_ORIENTATION=- /assembly_acc=CAM_ASM_000160
MRAPPAALLSSLVTIAAASTPLTQLAVHENFVSSEEIDLIARSINLDADSIDTFYGPTVLPPSVAERLRDLGGTCGVASSAATGNDEPRRGEAVMTMLMTATTDRHTDCHVPQSEGRVVREGDVAFVFLESDSRATFVHGDGLPVPAVAGNLVKFRGDVPHRTVVPPGSSVRIAGPFHLPTMEYVGSCPAECDNDAANCPGGNYWNRCVCGGDSRARDRDLAREAAKGRAMEELGALKSSFTPVATVDAGMRGFLRNVINSGRKLECTTICRESIGACCITRDTGTTCLDNRDVSTCFALNGSFMGPDTQCPSNVVCPKPPDETGVVYEPEFKPEDGERGLCCFQDGRPGRAMMRGYCEDITKRFFVKDGDGTCPPKNEMGACCMKEECRHMPVSDCVGKGGDWKGSESKCWIDCEGACCGADKCEIVTQTGANDNLDSTCEGTFTLGGDCEANNCPDKCESTFKSANTLNLPENGGINTVDGTTEDKDDPKDYFFECEETILHTGSDWHNIISSDTIADQGNLYTLTTCDKVVEGAFAEFETKLSLYKGECSGLACAAVESLTTEERSCDGNGGHTIRFCAAPSAEYHLMVHGYAGICADAAGKYTLAVKDEGPCPVDTTTAPTEPASGDVADDPEPEDECECVDESSYGKGKGATNSPGKGKGATKSPGKGKGATNSPGKGKGATKSPGKGKGATNSPGKGKGATNSPGKGKGATKSPSEGKGGTKSPGKGGTKSPGKGGTKSPGSSTCGGKGNGKGGTKSPGKGGTKSPGKGKGGTNSPGKGGTNSPGKGGTKSPGKGKGGTNSPGKGGTKSPGKGGTKSPGSSHCGGKGKGGTSGKGGTKSPGKGGTKSPGKGGTKSPGKGGTKSPGKGGTKSPGKGVTKSPGKGSTVAPIR